MAKYKAGDWIGLKAPPEKVGVIVMCQIIQVRELTCVGGSQVWYEVRLWNYGTPSSGLVLINEIEVAGTVKKEIAVKKGV